MKTHLLLAALSIFIWRPARAALDLPVEVPLEVMQNSAAAGDAFAQFELAVCYQEGQKTPKDPARALEWFRKAAAGGVSEAQFNLGVLMTNGVDAPRDLKEAARWFYAAAKNGFFPAQKMMVKIYSTGDGVQKSPASALAWDLLARRTLELRSGVKAGLPAKPGALRADGAAEVIGASGEKQWILPDGSQERIDSAGVRHVTQKNGNQTTIQTDGAWETVYPNGLREEVSAQGVRTLRDPKGRVEITELDGSRIVEGDGTSATGAKVRIRDTFNPQGKRILHCVVDGATTFEEREDGSRVLETRVKRKDGVDLVLAEKVSAEGAVSDGRLRRADNGEGPKDPEIWEIRRKMRLRGGEMAEMIERYSEEGLFFQQEVRRYAEAASAQGNGPFAPGSTPPRMIVMQQPIPMSTPAVPPPMVLPPRNIGTVTTLMPGGSLDDPTAFAPKPDITPELRELEQIEAEARNFAGATDADYQRAQAAAAAFLIPLSTLAPQKAGSPPTWFREKTITQASMHESPLVPILDDRSKVVPFGPHGAAIIKRYPWKHAETEHFIVHYLGEPEARLTVQYIEGAYVIVTQLLNLDPQRGPAKSHVFVFPEREWKNYLTAESLPPILAGFAYKTELLLGEAAGRQDRAESIKVLCHEVTHTLVSRFYGGRRLPLWLNEGLAEYMALRTMRAKGVLTASAPTEKKSGVLSKTGEDLARFVGKPDPAMDVARLFDRVRYGSRTTPDRMAAFYANSQKCLRVLFEKLPVEGFSTFFNTILAGNRPDVALSVAYGKQCDSVAAFQQIVNAKGP
jgi:Sel1 repeat